MQTAKEDRNSYTTWSLAHGKEEHYHLWQLKFLQAELDTKSAYIRRIPDNRSSLFVFDHYWSRRCDDVTSDPMSTIMSSTVSEGRMSDSNCSVDILKTFPSLLMSPAHITNW